MIKKKLIKKKKSKFTINVSVRLIRKLNFELCAVITYKKQILQISKKIYKSLI